MTTRTWTGPEKERRRAKNSLIHARNVERRRNRRKVAEERKAAFEALPLVERYDLTYHRRGASQREKEKIEALLGEEEK